MIIKKNRFNFNSSQLLELSRFVKKIISNGKFINGPMVKSFEKKFSNKIGSKYCVGYSSSSTAISSTMNILCSKGKEILIPAFSPIPVAAALKNYDLKLRYIDIDIDTFLMRSDLQNVISSKTEIIMPVHIFGNVFDIKDAQRKISNKINIVEDASQAHFSMINGKFAGVDGIASIYSFYPTKNLHALGDAGCVVTNNLSLYNKLRSYRNYGLHPKFDKLINTGNNFRMDEFQAKILSINLRKILKYNKIRSKIAKEYRNQLSNLPIKFQKVNYNVVSNNHVFSILVEKKYRNKLDLFLKNSGIETSIFYKKLLPEFTEKISEYKLKKNFPNSYNVSRSILNLPINPLLTKNEIHYICKKIKLFYKR
jgi:dTDP-4-amino-4,6-dideoxygalactose transaminase